MEVWSIKILICISNSEKQTKHFLSITNPIPTNSLQNPSYYKN